MKTYLGGCHCGAVRFAIVTDLSKAVECNCSVCRKKGALHHRVSPGNFELLSGKDALTLYQFGTKTARHLFCKYCGIHPFTNPRAAPDTISVNLRCLDDFETAKLHVEVGLFDGEHWDSANKIFNF